MAHGDGRHADFAYHQARAFRIWQFAESRGWDVTTAEIGEALKIPTNAVGLIARNRGWTSRLRTMLRDDLSAYAARTGRSGGLGSCLIDDQVAATTTHEADKLRRLVA